MKLILTSCLRPTIAQSVANVLRHHVKLSVEGIDRMYLNVYVPRLQTEQRIVWFFRQHRGQPIPSAALMGPMSRSFVAALEGFAAQRDVPLVQFRKGQRKDDVMAEHGQGPRLSTTKPVDGHFAPHKIFCPPSRIPGPRRPTIIPE
jgi:hypothetical protein